MPRTVVIRNPVSGRGRLVGKWPTLENQIREAVGETEYWDTKGPGDATKLAKKAVEEGYELVIAAGGDGTISQIAESLIHTTATLAIIPGGTGNDLARSLGVGPDIKLALKALKHGIDKEIDAGSWRIEDREGYFVNVAGMGFDAAVAERINTGYRTLRGTAAYIAATLGTLRTYQAQLLRLTIDGAVSEESILLTAIANARSYGGGMQIAPVAKLDDGLLDVVLVQEIRKWAFIKAFPSVFKGTHLGHPAVFHYRARSIVLEVKDERPFLIDGELVQAKKVEIEVAPKALKVRVPQN